MDAKTRIETALARLRGASRKVKIAPPAATKRVSQLEEEAGPLPPELLDYFRACNGVTLPEELPVIGDLLSVEQMLELDSPGFFAIGDDRSGNYDLVAARFEVNPGAVLFWDHETGELATVASSVCAYLEVWAARALVAVEPEKVSSEMFEALASLIDPEATKRLQKKLDPTALKLQRNRKFLAQLQTTSVDRVDRTGKTKPRMGVNPFTKEPMVLSAPPRKRKG